MPDEVAFWRLLLKTTCLNVEDLFFFLNRILGFDFIEKAGIEPFIYPRVKMIQIESPAVLIQTRHVLIRTTIAVLV